MEKMAAEQFLARVKLLAGANDIRLDVLEYSMATGLKCSWVDYGDEDEEDAIWSDTSQMLAQ